VTIETKFDTQQRVYVPDLNVIGTVIAIYVTARKANFTQYQVRYFADSVAKEHYFFEGELSSEIPPKGEALGSTTGSA
jgi:hypothetical protein